MDARAAILRSSTSRRRRYISVAICVAVTAVLAIAIPVAVLLSRHAQSKPLPPAVILPLYIYPSPGAWDPLYTAATTHPHLSFYVIVNPASGPGPSPYPNDDYASQIQKLNSYSNVKTIGYVRTGYGSRDIASVFQDISTYSNWPKSPQAGINATSLALHGIFFDETTTTYSPDAAEYLRAIDSAAKNASGLLSNRTVIHNPGTAPDLRLTNPNTDITVIFESSYDEFTPAERNGTLSQDRSRSSIIVHSAPSSLALKNFVMRMRQRARVLFLTDLSTSYYQKFGDDWMQFVDVVAG